MKVKVYMLANEEFAGDKPKVREVEIPDYEKTDDIGQIHELLEDIFWEGQNEVNPMDICSVSVGDVVELFDEKWLCMNSGWHEVSKDFADMCKIASSGREVYARHMLSRQNVWSS